MSRLPSCFIDSWVSRIYDTRFCIFCVPVPDNDRQHAHYLLLRPAHLANLPLCESELSFVWPLNSPTATWSFDLLIAWVYFALLGKSSLIGVLDWRHGLRAYYLSRCSWLTWLPADFFATNKGNASGLITREFISPFLGKFISFFISRHSLIPRYPY